jgi:hypothetical protein
MDLPRFDADRRTSLVATRVQNDARQALARGFQGTTSFTVSGPRSTPVLARGVLDSIQPSRMQSGQSNSGPLPIDESQAQQHQDDCGEHGAVAGWELERAGGGALDDRIELVVEVA